MEIESGVDMNNDILINEERIDDNSYDVLINEERIYNNSYKNCIARMDALKKIKKSVRDNYKNIASTLSTDEKIKFETAYSALKRLEEDEAFKMMNAK
jgi:hypothetical protein